MRRKKGTRSCQGTQAPADVRCCGCLLSGTLCSHCFAADPPLRKAAATAAAGAAGAAAASAAVMRGYPYLRSATCGTAWLERQRRRW